MDKNVPAPYTQVELWLVEHRVTSVKTDYTMTSADTCDDYVSLEASNGDKVRWLQSTFNKWATLRLSGIDLVELKYGVRDRVKKRLEYEKANAKELADYQRLKAKFEGEPK